MESALATTAIASMPIMVPKAIFAVATRDTPEIPIKKMAAKVRLRLTFFFSNLLPLSQFISLTCISRLII
jgi:hypothetical protein